jgi:ribonucleotide monophosphatase NagD (HAD superfamily)
MLPFLCQELKLKPYETCIVGDRLDTDIACGLASGLRTILALTGVCQVEDVEAAPAVARPDYIVQSLVDMVLNEAPKA